ncbi:MAG: hypothetical protein PSY14_05340 [bacterium]|nr:hypothetical protein [bacterium]
MTPAFNSAAPDKLNIYKITAALPAGTDVMGTLLATGHFREKLSHWIAAETGFKPDIELVDYGATGAVTLVCTAGAMKKVEAAFGTQIASVEKLPTYSDIPPSQRGPRGPAR